MKELLILAATSFELGTGLATVDWRDCMTSLVAEQRVEACTKIIDAGGIPPEMLAAPHWQRANAQVDLDELQAALGDFTKAIELSPVLGTPLLGPEGLFSSDTKKTDDAADLAEVVGEIGPAALHLVRAMDGASRLDLKTAKEHADTAIRLAPDLSAAYTARSTFLLAEGKTDDAMSDAGKAIELNPNSVVAFTMRAEIHVRAEDFAAALNDYDEALRLSPESIEVRIRRADLNKRTGNFELVAADYTHLLEPMLAKAEAEGFKDPLGVLQASYFLTERAYANWRLGKFEIALADHDKMIAYASATDAPPDSVLHAARAELLDSMGEDDRAIAAYRTALEIEPAGTDYHFGIGRAQFRKGEFAAAAASIELFENPDGYALLWLFLAQSRNGEDGMKDLAASAEKATKDWPYPLVEFYLGRSSAEETYAAAKDDGQRCETDFYIGQWDILKGDEGSAKRRLQAAVDTCWKTFIEYPAAVAELKRLD